MNAEPTDLPDCSFRHLVVGLEPGLDGLARFLAADHPWFSQLCELAVENPKHPYGRRVLVNNPDVEVMVARWTRDIPCAPHDHGGSVGAVRVLQGRSRHRIWSVTDDGLVMTREEIAEAGAVLLCEADVVHSMGDDGGEAPLITLHMYTKGIDHMVVYDTHAEETLVVDGSCGAWVPDDEPHKIRQKVAGFHKADFFKR